MASYTIEDIEFIRKKSGISYQEAVALLDYHNGNVARALVDLERNGRIKPEAAQAEKKTSSANGHKGRNGAMNLMSKLYHFRIKVKKENVIILNLSLLFALLALLISPHLVLVGVILMLILGYKVSIDKHDKDFASVNLEKMVRNAAQNVKESVSSMAQEFSETQEDDETPKAETATREKSEARSYYQGNPAATTYHASYGGSAPTLQVPVQVESQDGKVTLESDKDGFTSATIE